MRNFTWNRFPIKNLLIDSLLTPIVESTYLNYLRFAQEQTNIPRLEYGQFVRCVVFSYFNEWHEPQCKHLSISIRLLELLLCDYDGSRLWWKQGHNEARWRPGQEASLALLCLNLSFFGTKCTVLTKVLVTLLGLFTAHAVIRRPPQWFGPP